MLGRASAVSCTPGRARPPAGVTHHVSATGDAVAVGIAAVGSAEGAGVAGAGAAGPAVAGGAAAAVCDGAGARGAGADAAGREGAGAGAAVRDGAGVGDDDDGTTVSVALQAPPEDPSAMWKRTFTLSAPSVEVKSALKTTVLVEPERPPQKPAGTAAVPWYVAALAESPEGNQPLLPAGMPYDCCGSDTTTHVWLPSGQLTLAAT